MGINGLLPVLRPVTRSVHISQYAGHKVAIDGYSWLHKAVYSCAKELCLGQFTNKFVMFIINRVDMLRQNGVEPILVFDGGPLPMKAKEEDTRGRQRQENLDKGMAFMNVGNLMAAEQAFQKAVDVTPSMTKQVIEEMRAKNVRCLVAPYEADAQMAYLAIHGDVHAVLTEDSDLLTYGCPRVLFKLDKAGNGEEVLLADLHLNTTTSFVGFTHPMFQEMCVMAGCDFLPNLPQIGVKKAHGYIKKFKSFVKVCRHLRFEGRVSVPPNYEKDFQRALWVFRHQRVYCPKTHQCVHLRPLPTGGLGAADVDVPAAIPAQRPATVPGDPPEDDTDFLGPFLPPEIVQGIAEGELDPFTKKPFDLAAIYKGCNRPPPAVAAALGLGGGAGGGAGVYHVRQYGLQPAQVGQVHGGSGGGGVGGKPWVTLFDMRTSGGVAAPAGAAAHGSGVGMSNAAVAARSSSTGPALQRHVHHHVHPFRSPPGGAAQAGKRHSAAKHFRGGGSGHGSGGGGGGHGVGVKSPPALVQGSFHSLFAAAHKRSHSTLSAPFVPPSRVGQPRSGAPSPAATPAQSPSKTTAVPGGTGDGDGAGGDAAACSPGPALARPQKMFKIGLQSSKPGRASGRGAGVASGQPAAGTLQVVSDPPGTAAGVDASGVVRTLADRTNFSLFSCKPRAHPTVAAAAAVPLPDQPSNGAVTNNPAIATGIDRAAQADAQGWISRKRKGIAAPAGRQHDDGACDDGAAGDVGLAQPEVANTAGATQEAGGVRQQLQVLAGVRPTGRPQSAIAALATHVRSGGSTSQAAPNSQSHVEPHDHPQGVSQEQPSSSAQPADAPVTTTSCPTSLDEPPSSARDLQTSSCTGGTCMPNHLMVTSSEDTLQGVQGGGQSVGSALPAPPGAGSWTPEGHARLLYDPGTTPRRVGSAGGGRTPCVIPATPSSGSRRLRNSGRRQTFPWLQETEDQVQLQLCQAGLRSLRPAPSIAVTIQAASPDLMLRGRKPPAAGACTGSDPLLCPAEPQAGAAGGDGCIRAANVFKGFEMRSSGAQRQRVISPVLATETARLNLGHRHGAKQQEAQVGVNRGMVQPGQLKPVVVAQPVVVVGAAGRQGSGPITGLDGGQELEGVGIGSGSGLQEDSAAAAAAGVVLPGSSGQQCEFNAEPTSPEQKQQQRDVFHSVAHVQQYAKLAVTALDDVEQAVKSVAGPVEKLAQFACAAAGKGTGHKAGVQPVDRRQTAVECVTIDDDDEEEEEEAQPGTAAIAVRLHAGSGVQRKQVAAQSAPTSGGWISKASRRKGHVAGLRRPSKGSGAVAGPSVFVSGEGQGLSTHAGGSSSKGKGKQLVQAKLGLGQFAFTRGNRR